MDLKIRVLGVFLAASMLAGCYSMRKLTPEERFHELTVGFTRSYRNFDRRCRTARAGQEFIEAFASDPRPKYAAKFLQLAKEYPSDPVAEDAVIWVIANTSNIDMKDRTEAVKIVKARYVKSSKLVDVVPLLKFSNDNDSQDLLRVLSKSSPHRDVQSLACLMLAEKVKGNDPEEAKALLHTALKDSSQTKSLDENVIAMARSDLYDLEHLSIGQPAPKMEGEDADGKKLKLSDYRGKVVLISFFGDWCGPCRSLFPHERSLVQQFKSKAFVLLGVNSDPRQKLKDLANEKTITWRSFWDGGDAYGPIAKSWNVRRWPVLFVIDRKGIIRFRSHYPDNLDQLLSKLLEEKS